MAFSMFATPQPQQSQQLFQPQTQSQPQPFQTSSSFLSQPQQQQQQQQQQQPQQQFQQQQQFHQPQQQQQQFLLFTNDKTPASYSTKWSDLHPDSQKVLLQIEERILEYRDESQRLEQCSRLYDSSVSNDGFEHDASHIVQELGGINSAMEQQKATLQQLMNVVKDMLRNTEVAIRSFMMLRPRFLHPNGGASNPTALSQAPGGSLQPGSSGQQAAMSMVPVFDFYNGLPRKPSPFLQQTIFRFEKYLSECHQWIEELEQLLILDSERKSLNSGMTLLQSLPKVMSNVHDFFVHVAAKVENIRQYIESMKTSYLADQRRRGNGNDPFLEADRREIARQEAAAKRAHLTLHLSLNSQPSTQVAGLFSSTGSHGVTSTPQISTTIATASSGSGLSLFSTPAPPASSMTPSLFATPAASGAASPLFGSYVAIPQTSLFGTSSTSLFSTATSFGSSSPLITSSASSGSSLFSTPFASGAAQGSGASFGAASKSSKPKSRTARRY